MPLETGFEGTHVLVTGGSRGVGKAIVEAFLAEGVNVFYCARWIRDDEFEPVAHGKNVVRAVGSVVDITLPEQVEAWVRKAAEEFGRINSVVANASPCIQGRTSQYFITGFQADVVGTNALIQAALPYLEKQGQAGRSASVVVVSSLAGFESCLDPPGNAYAVSKRAQVILAKDLSRVLARKGVRINTVTLAMIETPPFTAADGREHLTSMGTFKSSDPVAFQDMLSRVPLQRTGRPAEVATAVLFLASQLAGFINGANLAIDGGMSVTL